MKRVAGFMIILVILLASCNLPQPAAEATVDPDLDLMGTMVAATLQAMTPFASPQLETSTPAPTETPAATATPNMGKVSGKVCYQGKGMVELTLYFQEAASDKVWTQSVSRPTETYSIDLPPGKYKIYGWPPDFTMGVLVKDKVTVDVDLSHPVTNIDFCDYSKGPFAAPYPPGVSPSKTQGSIAGNISGYQGEGALTVVAFNQANAYWYYFILLIGQTTYEIPNLPAGRYQVVAYGDDGAAAGTDTNIYVVAGQRTIADISNWGGGYPSNPAPTPPVP